MDCKQLIEKYFAAEESGDVETIVDLCDSTVVIRNAAQPALYGKEGARQFASDFKARTDRRKFTILAIAQEADVAFAHWKGSITFKAGVKFGPIVAKRPFTVELKGVCRFKINRAGQFVEIDVYHETTTALRLAQEASK